MFKLKNEIEEYLQSSVTVIDLLTSELESAEWDLHLESKRINEKVIQYTYINSNMDKQWLKQTLAIKSPSLDLSIFDNLPRTYSKFNLLAWYRLLHKLYIQYLQEISELKKAARYHIHKLNEFEETVNNYPSLNNKYLSIIKKIKRELSSLLDKQIKYASPKNILEMLFLEGQTITKNETMSLLQVEHTKENMTYINALSEIIDYDTFQNITFVHMVESDGFYFDYIYDQIRSVPEIQNEMRLIATELITHKPHKDNKPTLNLMKS